MDNEAIIRYKFYLCRNFLDKLLSENLITEAQRRKIEKAVIKRITEFEPLSAFVGSDTKSLGYFGSIGNR